MTSPRPHVQKLGASLAAPVSAAVRPPLPVYDAHVERLVEVAQTVMDVLIETLAPDSNARRPTRRLAAELTRWANARVAKIDPATALRAVLTWSHSHGFVSLEIAGNYASMGINPDQLFEAELSQLAS